MSPVSPLATIVVSVVVIIAGGYYLAFGPVASPDTTQITNRMAARDSYVEMYLYPGTYANTSSRTSRAKVDPIRFVGTAIVTFGKLLGI